MRDKHHHCGTYNCDGGKRKGIAYHNQVYQIACYQVKSYLAILQPVDLRNGIILYCSNHIV